jgi:hypothetical protein
MAEHEPTGDIEPGDIRVEIGKDAPTPWVLARSPDGVWWCELHFRDEDGHLAFDWMSRLVPWPVRPGERVPPLTTDVLRSLPLGRWLALAHSRLAEMPDWSEAVDPEQRAWAREVVKRVRNSELRRGRRGFPADFYRGIALEYLALQKKGVSRGIQQQLAKQESKRLRRPVSWQSVRDWVHRATELGFLSKGTPGRSGRLPGPNLYTDRDTEEN